MTKTLPKLPARTRAPSGPARTAAAMFGDLALAGRLRTVPLERIVPNPRQPRQRFDPDALNALAASISERGVLQPPVVRETSSGQLELIAGERRWRAAAIAGVNTIEVLVKDVDDAGSLEDAVMENVARQDLSPIEKARAYATMIDDLGITREAVGRRVGQSRESISNHLRLLDLPDDILELIDAGELSFAHGRALLLCDDHTTRRELGRRAAAHGWSSRHLEQAAREAGAPRARRPQRRMSAEHQALAQRLGDAVTQASGVEVRVRAAAKDAYTFTIYGHDAVRIIAQRLGAEGLDELL
jgi:ParB family transcriptional regulator, chromosome partitioning protein